MLPALSIVVGIANLICFIIVVIQLFKQKGALHGILGILCGLYTFIWGWINAKRLNLTRVMLIWSVVFGASIVINAINTMQAVSAIQSGQQPAGLPASNP